MKYNVIEIFTSEEARCKGAPIWEAVIEQVRKLGIAARVMVSRGIAGCYENGELASNKIEALSFSMPIKIEIIFPSAELNTVLPLVEELVTDGIVAVEDMQVRVHRAQKRLIPRQLRVKDVMTKPAKSVSEETPANDIVRLLLTSEFNAVPVVDPAGHPVGIITQSDLIHRAGMPVRLALLGHMDPEKIETYLETIPHKTAGEIMTKPVITVNPDKRLSEAVDVMLQHHLKRFPVVDSERVLVGIVARSDIFHAITRETPDWDAIRTQSEVIDVKHAVLVRDIMRRDTQTVLPESPIEEVMKIIDSSDIQRVAVVDGEDHLLGIISDSDLLGMFSDHRAGLWDYLVRRLPFTELAKRHEDLIKRTSAKTAADVMKTDLVTVKEDTPVEEAIKLMVEHEFKRLPVLDDRRKFRGMVSRDSLLRAGIAH
jgi:CBS domain-containing protein